MDIKKYEKEKTGICRFCYIVSNKRKGCWFKDQERWVCVNCITKLIENNLEIIKDIIKELNKDEWAQADDVIIKGAEPR